MLTKHDWLSRIERLHPDSIKLGLDRVAKVAKRLDLIYFDCPVITIAGTNGKGSSVKFLETILHAAGYRVGAYTSPHLITFNERIRIDFKNVTDNALCNAFQIIEANREGTPLTFFEYTTLTALLLFKQAKLDALILEVGLGGLLDAVNVVDSDISIITSVDIDHMDWLGDTREKIGLQKAGIFRPGKVAICGDENPPNSLLNYANKLSSNLYCVQRDFSFHTNEHTWSWYSKDKCYSHLPLPSLPIQNAATVMMAISKLKEELEISHHAICHGLRVANLPGRFQIIQQPYPCILDVAHNPASAEMLANKLEALGGQQKFTAVVGMLEDKDIANTLKPMIPWIDSWHLGDLKVPRGASASHLISQLPDSEDLECYTYNCISDAFEAAANRIKSEKILVFGSFHTVAEVFLYVSNQCEAILA